MHPVDRYILLICNNALRHRTLLVICLLLCMACLEGQGLSPALQNLLRQREVAMSRLETRWQWFKKCPSDSLRQETVWTWCGLGDRFAFWGDLPAVDNPTVRSPERAILYDNGVFYPEVMRGRTVMPFTGWILNDPLLYIVLGGRDPTRWLKSIRVMEIPGSNEVIVEGIPDFRDAPYQVYKTEHPVRLHIDSGKGGAVSRIEFARVDARQPGEIRINQWKRYQSVWLPARIVLQNGALGCAQTLTLLDARDSPMNLPDWAMQGGPVNDFRLSFSDLGRGVSYEMRGQLPDLEEVRRMKEPPQAGSRPASSGWKEWRLIPPVLLIAIGALWYWRLKRAERKASSP